MSELRVSDPSRLHLRRELTQIKKAARVLRDPGTSSSWKSPLNSSRSVALPLPSSAASARRNDGGRAELDIRGSKDKEKAVFLYNWKARDSSNNAGDNEVGDGDRSVSSSSEFAAGGSIGDSLSDAHCNSVSASALSRRRDASLEALGIPSMKRPSASAGVRKQGKKLSLGLDGLSSYVARKGEDMFSGRGQSSTMALLGGDDTDRYSNSEDTQRACGASPLLFKLKHKNWAHSSSKLLRTSRRGDSSYTYSTPALSTSSLNRYRNRNPSTVGSWDGTATSMNDGDDEDDDQLDLPSGQGCGIPCYWSKRTPKHQGMCGSCCSPSLSERLRRKGSSILCSPSLSETLRRKGSSILCGTQSMYNVRRRSVSGPAKRNRIALKSAQGVLPLLAHSGDVGGISVGTGNSDDELSTNFGELDLEALSRLDGRRWSNCRSQDGSEILALNGDREEESAPENSRSLSQKYKPVSFHELIGQNIVVQSLSNAVSRGRVAPVYLFQGPRGTGKTSTARIFAAALNCLATDESKPCGSCKGCNEFMSGKSKDLSEVDGTNKEGIDKVRYLLKKLSVRPPVPSDYSRYKVFIIDECHLLSSKMWLAFLKFVEDPPRRVVFIFITTDLDNVPRTVQSRCQKYIFNKIKDSDMVGRLRKISADENLDIEADALDLIAMNADGSLRDAETMLDQLSLFGKRITTSLVNELVGVVSEEKLLDLLELALSSNTAETVKRARDLMDAGVDPLVLMSQLASLIMDIIAGTHKTSTPNNDESTLDGGNLSEAEVERLKHALKLLSDAVKQFRVSSERSTWVTATLLQLGSVQSPEISQSSSSRRQSSRTTDEDLSCASRDYTYRRKSDGALLSASPAALLQALNSDNRQGDVSSQIDDFISKMKASHEEYVNGCTSDASFDDTSRSNVLKFSNFEKLNIIWRQCIDRCHSKTLRQLLHAHGKLVSISEADGILVAYVAFGDKDIKSRAERFLSSITNSIEAVVRRNVEVRMIFLPGGDLSNTAYLLDSPGLSKSETALAIKKGRDAYQESLKISRGSFNNVEGKLKGGKLENARNSPLLVAHQPNEGASGLMGEEANQKEAPIQRIESIIREQRLETAWLQTAEKGTPVSFGRLRPEKNQVLPQEGSYDQHQLESVTSTAFSSHNYEDELIKDLKALKVNDVKTPQKDNGSKAHYPMSPSLLHDTNFAGTFNMESLAYESASGTEGCGAMFCWNNRSSRKLVKPIIKRTSSRSRRHGRFSMFGRCMKTKPESRLRKQTVE